MAWLAMRGCAWVNGVSQLHGAVSRRLFAGLFPRWPLAGGPDRACHQRRACADLGFARADALVDPAPLARIAGGATCRR